MSIGRLTIGVLTGLCAAVLHSDRAMRGHPCSALTLAGDEMADVNKTLSACIAFIDTHHTWNVESSNFDQDGSEARIQLMRLPLQFVASDGNAVPVLRLVAFLPRVSPDEVYEQITDLRLRPSWDSNYQFYERAPTNATEKVPLVLQNIRRPVESVSDKICLCNGDQCELRSDVDVTVIDHDWYSHCVGSRMLGRVGVASRLFKYERITYKYTAAMQLTGRKKNCTCAYDILFCGSSDLVRRATALAPSLDHWFSLVRQTTRSQDATVNYQHLAIMPVNNIAENVVHKLGTEDSIIEMGSIQDKQSTRNFYRLLSDSWKLQVDEGDERGGTLIVMTSANYVNVPRAVPLWAQKRLSYKVADLAYSRLLHSIVEGRKEVDTRA